jgi:hypothetical protein
VSNLNEIVIFPYINKPALHEVKLPFVCLGELGERHNDLVFDIAVRALLESAWPVLKVISLVYERHLILVVFRP